MRWITILVLLAGAVWIWFSRTTPGETISQVPAPRPGFLAPDFSLQTADGETIRLSELRGRPVLINVWASWCIPCRSEMPALERVYQQYRDLGFEILGINSTVQDDPIKAVTFAKQQGLTFPILLDNEGEVTKTYQVRALPTSFFVDANGIIQEVVVGGPMSEALLRIRVAELTGATQPEAP